MSEEVERLRAKKKQIYEDLEDLVEREWVELTGKDFQDAWRQSMGRLDSFSRAIEVKLKEKNT